MAKVNDDALPMDASQSGKNQRSGGRDINKKNLPKIKRKPKHKGGD